MVIRRADDKDYKELLTFYERMCQVLGEKEFLPDGDKGGFPSGEMIKGAIVRGQQFVGIEDERIVAAYIMDHDCDKAYDLVKWQVNAEKEKVVILHALRVLPEYGKRGYSRKLVEHAISTAEKWGLSIRRVQTLCSTDRIPGAVKIGSYWAIPIDAEKPKDERIKTGRYIKKRA